MHDISLTDTRAIRSRRVAVASTCIVRKLLHLLPHRRSECWSKESRSKLDHGNLKASCLSRNNIPLSINYFHGFNASIIDVTSEFNQDWARRTGNFTFSCPSSLPTTNNQTFILRHRDKTSSTCSRTFSCSSVSHVFDVVASR